MPMSFPPDLPGRVERLCREVLRPRAEKVDTLALPLADNFDALAHAGLAGLPVPAAFGGLDAPPAVQRQVAREMAAACGVTHFTVAQHWSACKILAHGQAEPLKARLLPLLARGQRWVAISFAHLRRGGAPLLRATPVEGGFQLDGTAPWVTGYGLMDSCVFGATLPDGNFVYLWAPFPGTQDATAQQGEMRASEVMALCAMTASATVSLDIAGWFVPAQHVLVHTDAAHLEQQDHDSVLNGTNMTLGALQAAARLLEETAVKKPLPSIRQAADHWRDVSRTLEAEVEALLESPPLDFPRALALRARTIEQAVRGAHAAVAAISGAANLLSNPAQRVLREAMFYTIQAQTRDVQDETLRLLGLSVAG